MTKLDHAKPEAVVIGPMKAATTWVDRYLRSRGDVCLPQDVKETFFFDRNYGRGLDWYLGHFAQDTMTCTRLVEVAPSYFHSQAAPARMKEALGDVRLVAVLRDPVTRAFSHYLHLLRYGFTGTDLRQSVAAYPEIVSASAYATCLRRWFDVFGRDRILVLFQHDIAERPNAFVHDLCAHLGLDYLSPGAQMSERVNEAAMPSSRLLAAAGQKVADGLRTAGLYRLVNLAKSLGLKEVFFGKPGGKELPKLSEDDRAWLSEMLAQEVVELEDMLGVDLSRWKVS